MVKFIKRSWLSLVLLYLVFGARVLDKPTCRVYYVMWKLSCLSEAYPLTESYYRLWAQWPSYFLLPHPNPMRPKTCVGWLNCITWKSQTLAMLAVGQGVTHHIEGTAQQPHQIPTFRLTVTYERRRGPPRKGRKALDDYYQWRPPWRPRSSRPSC